METGDSTSLYIFPPYPDYSQTLLPSHEKTVTVAVTVERIRRDEALDIYTEAALKVYCREFNGDCVQRGENQIEKEIRLVTTQYPPSAKTRRRKDNLPKWGAPRRQCRHSHEGFGTHFGADAQEIPGSAKGRHCEGFRIVTGW